MATSPPNLNLAAGASPQDLQYALNSGSDAEVRQAHTTPQGQLPNGQMPAAQNPPGAVKSYLSNLLYNIGEYTKKQAGLLTDDQKQQMAIQNQQKQQELDTQEGYRQMQGQAIAGGLPTPVTQQQADMYKGFGLDVAPGSMLTPKQHVDLLKQVLQNKGKTDTQALKNEGGLDIQGLKNDFQKSLVSERRSELEAKLANARSIAAGHDNTRLSAAQMVTNRMFMIRGADAYKTGLDADTRYQQMLEQAANPNPAADKALLFNHIAMTIGAVKGGRVTQAEIDAHLKARDLPSDIMQAWDKVETGRTLTADQRANFLKLGAEVRNSIWDQSYRKAELFGIDRAPIDNPALPPAQTHVAKPGSGSGIKTAADFLAKKGLSK